MPSQEICKKLFVSETLVLIGLRDPVCQLDGPNIIITLGTDQDVGAGSILHFLPKIASMSN